MAEPHHILASQSAARRQMLASAGLTFAAIAADVDEAALKVEFEGSDRQARPEQLALHLAKAKAEAVSRDHPEALVIGADQVLAFENAYLTKAKDRDAARAVLGRLSGKTHHLYSAVAMAEAGITTWSAIDSAELEIRPLSETFITEYLDAMGDRVLKTVGCYELEGLGAQLFARVDGDYFTVLGMPLLPLLAELRRKGTMTA